MKYYIDQEFKEGFNKPLFGKKRHYIDLISIGIVCEDGREYYAVSKEFDLKAAWNDEWLRDNVLKPIYNDLIAKEGVYGKTYFPELMEWSYKGMRNLIAWHGKTNERITYEVLQFMGFELSDTEWALDWLPPFDDIEIYGYYADYDWVLFCSLFGRMIDLPKGMPMYCRDLKQMLDEATAKKDWHYGRDIWSNTREKCDDRLQDGDRPASLKEKLEKMKRHHDYPILTNEHNALDDARWNKKLHEFINQLS